MLMHAEQSRLFVHPPDRERGCGMQEDGVMHSHLVPQGKQVLPLSRSDCSFVSLAVTGAATFSADVKPTYGMLVLFLRGANPKGPHVACNSHTSKCMLAQCWLLHKGTLSGTC